MIHHSFLKSSFALMVIVVTVLGELNIVEIYLRILGDYNSPPSPHQTTQQSTHHQLRHQLLPSLNIFWLLPQHLKLGLELLMRIVLSDYIGINKSDFHLLVSRFLRDDGEEGFLWYIVVNLAFLEIVGNVIEGKVERSVFKVNENEFSIVFSD